VPANPDVPDIPLIRAPIVKFTELLSFPETFTITGPLLAVFGMTTTMLVLLQLVGLTPFPASAIPLRVTVLNPMVAPNPDP